MALGLLGASVAQVPSDNIVYDVSQSFDAARNPNGVWSYGWKSTLTGPFTLLSAPDTVVHENGVPVQVWGLDSWIVPPLVVYNATTNTSVHDSGQGVYPPGTLYCVAGADGTPQNFAAIRFTVPGDGDGGYRIESAVRGYLDGDRSGDTDFHLVVNDAEVFSEFLAARSATGYTNTFELATGDTVDFLVGRGVDGRLSGSGLKIQATLSHPLFCSVARRATATAQVVNGFLVGIELTDPGCGYPDSPPPFVQIRDASGKDAAVRAVVKRGVLEQVVIDNPGRSYSANTQVLIAPPPFAPSLSVAVSRVNVRMTVVLGRKYQLEVSPDLQDWTPLGDPFVATDDFVVQEFEVTEATKYFRIWEVF